VFEKIPTTTYTVTVKSNNESYGTVQASHADPAAGTPIILTATPKPGYHFVGWIVTEGGIDVTPVTENTGIFVMPSRNVAVTATFEPAPAGSFSVTVTSMGNGAATASSTVSKAGNTITLTATPGSGQRFKQWTVTRQNGNAIVLTSANTTATFVMPAYDVTATAEFEPIPTQTYHITVPSTVDVNRSDPTPGTIVTLTLKALPNGAQLKQWIVKDGAGNTIPVTLGAGGTGAFIMPHSDVTVAVELYSTGDPLYTAAVTVTPVPSEGGTVTNPASAAEGTTVTLTATPYSGYRVKHWTVTSGGVTLSSTTGAQVTFIMGRSPVTVNVVFEPAATQIYNISVEAIGDGTITVSQGQASAGTTITLEAKPGAGHRLKHWIVRQSEDKIVFTSTDATTIFTMPPDDVKVTAEFEAVPPQTYHVTTPDTVDASHTDPTAGTVVTLTPKSQNGKRVKQWTVTDGSGNTILVIHGPGDTGIFAMPDSDVTVNVEFETIPEETLHVTVEPNDGTVTVSRTDPTTGTPIVLTVTPQPGKHLTDLSVKGDTEGGQDVPFTQATGNTWVFVMPAYDVTVTAIFESVPEEYYSVTIVPSENGTLQASPSPAKVGETVTLTATPNPDYRIKQWTATNQDGIPITVTSGTGGTGTFVMPLGGVKAKVEFEPIPPQIFHVTVTPDNPDAGTASPSRSDPTVGTAITLTATPNESYRFKQWSAISGGVTLSDSTANPTTFVMPQRNVEIRAEFEEAGTEPHAIYIIAGGEGAGTAGANKNSATMGTTITLTATPDLGSRFKQWIVTSGGPLTSVNLNVNPTTFIMPDNELFITAEFEREDTTLHTITLPSGIPGGTGTVSVPGGKASKGTIVELKATPKPGYVFIRWEVTKGNPTWETSQTANPAFIIVQDDDVEVAPIFAQTTGGGSGGGGGTEPAKPSEEPTEPGSEEPTEPGGVSEAEAAAHSEPRRTPVYDAGDESVPDDLPLNIPEPTARAEKQPLVMAHYQPWYQVPAVNGRFNHWNLGTSRGTSSKTLAKGQATASELPFDLTETLPNGQANIGSNYYPLTGPYDSRDADTLEYQVALMKIAGIDGLIFDWYGDKNFSDYGLINEGFVAMVKMLERAKLKFSICYEDNTIAKMIGASAITEENAVPTAKEEMKWLNDNYFQKTSYVKTENDRPVLLRYGPEYFSDPSQWNTIVSETSTKPYFVDLAYETKQARPDVKPDAEFEWLAMPASGELRRGHLVQQLNWFYNRYKDASYLVGTAFPSYDDSPLKDAKLEDAASSLQYRNGETFKLMLDAARRSRLDIVQLATWNDYGEGTMIEPTAERGYKELEEVQVFNKNWRTNSLFTSADLRVPIELLKIAKDPSSGTDLKALVAKAYDELFNDNVLNFRLYAQQAIDAAAKPATPTNPADPDDGTNGDEDSGGGGGCNAGTLTWVLLAMLPAAFAVRASRQKGR
jgi:hypothetical protein